MKKEDLAAQRSGRVWLNADSCDLEDFKMLINRQTKHEDYPFAAAIEKNVPIYDGNDIRKIASAMESRKSVMAEWAEVLLSGPGILVFKNATTDMEALDMMSTGFNAIIAEQHASGKSSGDHFAKPGANDRIWNALEKMALHDPVCFARYYANDMIAMVSQSWLGLGYQVTSQVNVVNPGGQAQSMHRDYHMGFQTAHQIAQFPAHAHMLSPALTLQGAVAHCDMPIETGPTLYLPFSQTYAPGYFASARPEFQTYFTEHKVQLPLAKGDMAFFNPALFHAAGTNTTKDVRRMANLLQVSSAYGRAMEQVDRAKMSATLYPVLQKLNLGPVATTNAVAACAEGYAFPTNLDLDPPIGGLAPESQAAMMCRALSESWTLEKFQTALTTQAQKKLT